MGTRHGRMFDLDDDCRLKSDPSLVGHVCRTHYDTENHEPLDDILIVSYTSVPESIMTDFLVTGEPPKGYVFVAFLEPSQGNSLVHEDDLELVDRPMELGESVKHHLDDTMSGTVISTSAKCCLEPIAYPTTDPATGEPGPVKFAEKVPPRACSVTPRNDDSGPPPLLRDVPMSELTYYDDFAEGDYIVYRQKLGLIHRIERDAVLLLPNQKIVTPYNPSALELPLCSTKKNIAALPSRDFAMDLYPLEPSRNKECIWSMETDFVFPGQFVFTKSTNLGRDDVKWGNETFVPEGYVLATPAEEIHVDWICPNVFAAGGPGTGTNTNSEIIRASVLRGNAVRCEFGRLPPNSTATSVKSDTWLKAGDRARFRDPKDAAAKYAQYQPIPPGQSPGGYDLNLLRIVSTKTDVTVRWQDGRITQEETTALHRFTGAEDEVWPAELVVLKDAIQKIPVPWSSRHEALLRRLNFNTEDTVRANKVGVVQSVDSKERIASVRWYKDPKVELLCNRNMLRTGSYLGELGDETTDVSLYELTMYDCLRKSLNDTVLLAPQVVHQSAIPTGQGYPDTQVGSFRLGAIAPMTFTTISAQLRFMKLGLVNTEWFKETTTIDTSPLPPRYSVHNVKSPTNFVGKIISMDVDGTITVRMSGADNCQDIQVPLERIMLVLDGEDPLVPVDVVPSAGLIPGASMDPFHPLEDNPSGEDEWMTEDEYDDDHHYYYDDEGIIYEDDLSGGPHPPDNLLEPDLLEPEVSDIITPEKDEPPTHDEAKAGVSEETPSQEATKPSILSRTDPSSCPPSFSLLEDAPPSDHRFISHNPPANLSISLKRIRKEFAILSSSLPPGIFVRTWESRMDLLRALIIGPQGTPYEHAPFVIDLHFSDDFPNKPPAAFFHSWTNRQGMINPNLYEDGKICLSILGTWPTDNPEETWNPVKSTVLQILVSIMGLVLVKAPFYNEPGFESLAADNGRRIESGQYTEKAFLMTRRFVLHALEHPVAGLEDILAWHYLPAPQPQEDSDSRPRLLARVIREALSLIEHHNETSGSNAAAGAEQAAAPFVSRLSLGAVVMLRKHVTALEQIEGRVAAAGDAS